MLTWILDLALVLIFVLCVCIGRKRGFIKTMTGVLAFFAAAAVAFLLHKSVANVVYDKGIEPSILTAVEENLPDGQATASSVDLVLEKLPDFVQNMLDKNEVGSGADVLAKVTVAAEPAAIAQQISDTVVRPVVLPVLQMLCVLVLFLVALLAARLLLRVLHVVAKLPVLKQLNKTGGVLAGIVSGLLWVLFAVAVLQVVAAVSGPEALLHTALLQKTYVVRFVMTVSPLSQLLQGWGIG